MKQLQRAKRHYGSSTDLRHKPPAVDRRDPALDTAAESPVATVLLPAVGRPVAAISAR